MSCDIRLLGLPEARVATADVHCDRAAPLCHHPEIRVYVEASPTLPQRRPGRPSRRPLRPGPDLGGIGRAMGWVRR